ncbi:MAG: hypothetical protein DME46_00760 [Verrucomicrobia bacterium]|nr:MAG: hypothetical protein DME46_00760 [Verrucomicrobiota bacterium]
MKSAYELAMERLQKSSATVTLTAEEKAQLAEIDSSFNAKIAERKIFLTDEIRKAAAAGKFDDVESLEKQLAADVIRLQEDCQHKKEKLRATFGAG